MATKKVTGGFVTVSKAGRVGTKVFTTKAGAEKVQRTARKNLATTRGGKGGAKPKPKSKGSNPAAASTEPSEPKKPARMGAIYQTAKVTAEAAVPLTDYALIPGPKTAMGLQAHLRARANFELAKGYGVAAADAALSKSRFVGHAGALSRKSVTALAPEAFAVVASAEDVRAKAIPRTIHERAVVTQMGYNPSSGATEFQNPRFRTYHKVKWIGAGVRAFANRTRIGGRVFGPIKKALSMLGGTI